MSCEQFIADSLALRTAVHLAHFSTQSYSQHMALGEYYEALTDLIDRYAETYMGLEGRVSKFPRADTPTEAPVTLLEDYLDDIRAEMEEDEQSQACLNILAEIEEQTARTLYKLKNLR